MGIDTVSNSKYLEAGDKVESAEHSSLPMVILEKTRISGCNNAFINLIGLQDPKEIVNRSIKNLLTPSHFKKLLRYLNDEAEIPSAGIELELLKKGGAKLDALGFLAPIPENGDGAFRLSVIDISERMEQIRKLSHAERQYRELIEHSPEGVASISDGKIVFVNGAFAALFGYETSEELNGSEYSVIVPEEERDRFAESLQKFEKKKVPTHSTGFTGRRKDGKEFKIAAQWVRTSGQSRNEFLAYHRDETEFLGMKENVERIADETLILNEIVSSMDYSRDLHQILQAGLNKILETVKGEAGGVFLHNKSKRSYDMAIRRNLPDGMIEKLDLQSADEGIGGFLSKTLEAQVLETKKFPSYLPHGKLFKESGFISLALIPLVVKESCNGFILVCSKKSGKENYPSKDFFGILGREIGSAVKNARTFRDLKQSEEDYKRLIESTTGTLYRASIKGAFSYVSPVIEHLVGYPPSEFYKNPTLWLSLVHKEDKKFLLERHSNIDALGESLLLEYRILPRGKASYRWVRDENAILRDEKGEVSGISGLIIDITNFKNQDEELLQSNELNSSILSSMREGVVVYNTAFKCIQWNDSMEVLTGLKKEEVLGKPILELFVSDSDNDILSLIEPAFKGELVQSEDFRYRLKANGKELFMSGRYGPLRGSGGEIIGAVGIIIDVSERREFERELKESEQVLRNIIDTIGDILMITDLQGTVRQVNRAFVGSLGYDSREVIGQEFPYPWLIEEEMGRYVVWTGSLREKNWLHDFDMTWKAKDGRLISMSLSTTLLRNSMGEPIAMVNVARDISERKRLTKDLENRNKQVELLNRIISEANQSMDFSEIIGIVGKELQSVIPFDDLYMATVQPEPGQLQIHAAIGDMAQYQGVVFDGVNTLAYDAIQSRTGLISHDLLESRYKDYYPAIAGFRSKIAIPIILKDKVLGSFGLVSRTPNLYNQHHLSLLESLTPQLGAIMDRIALFRQVSEDASYIHNLLDSIDSVVYTIDTKFRILEVNKAWYEFIHDSGQTPLKDYQGMKVFDALPDEALKVLFQGVAADVLSGGVRFFSQEFTQTTPGGVRTYQLTMNPMIIDKKITGLVISHSDITALKDSELALKENNERLITLNEIAALQSTARELKDILGTAVPLLRKMIGADAAVVYLVERGGKTLELAHQMGFKQDATMMLPGLTRRGSMTGIVVGSKEAVYVSNLNSEDHGFLDSTRAFLSDEHIRSLAIIPLMSKNDVVGALDIFYRSHHEFAEKDRQLLSLIGNQLGTAIENAQLYGELRSQIDRLTVLYEFSEQLTSKLDINQIYEVVYEHVARVIPFKKFVIYLSRAVPRGVISGFEVVQDRGQYLVQPSQTVSRELAQESPGWKVFESKRSFHNDDYSAIYVPMFSKESIIGVMALEGQEHSTYSDIHLRLLESIANLTAIALEKGKLYEETVHKSLEIERRNRELDDFTYVVSHDLKEPLISIEGFSKILQIDYRDLLKGEGKEYLDSITGASVRMKALIDDLLMLSRVSRLSESLKPVSVDSVIKDIQNDMEFTIRQRNVRFEVPANLPMVFGHEPQVKILFRNLIGNALKFNKDPEPRVEIGFQNGENNYYLFYVRDNGIGIEKDFFDKIFVIFQRLHRREDYEGTGAGLAIVKKIIEIHQGKIWVESEPKKGSTFYFTLPKYT